MVLVIDAAQRERFAPALTEMHRIRKQVFVDRLHWNLPVVNGEFEIDQFDAADPVYLLCLDRHNGAHLGSVRLLPSTGPHLLADLFPTLCAHGVPKAPEIWEITRLCATPGLARERALRVRHKISAALMEFALLHGIERYTCVLNVAWLSTLLAPGWPCEPLGPPQEINGELTGAFAITISPTALDVFLQRWGGAFPVLEFPDSIAA